MIKEKITLVVTSKWKKIDEFVQDAIDRFKEVGLDLEVDLKEFKTDVPFEPTASYMSKQYIPSPSWVEKNILPLKSPGSSVVALIANIKDSPPDNEIIGRLEWVSGSENWLWGASNDKKRLKYPTGAEMSEITYLILHEFSHYLRNSRSVLDNTHIDIGRYKYNLQAIMNGLPTYPAYKVEGESTIVLKKDGKLFPIATVPELWATVKAKFNIQDNLPLISRDELQKNLGGVAEVDIYFKNN